MNPRTSTRRPRKTIVKDFRPTQPFMVVIPDVPCFYGNGEPIYLDGTGDDPAVLTEQVTMAVNATNGGTAIEFAKQNLVSQHRIKPNIDIRFKAKAVKVGAPKIGDTYEANVARAVRQARELISV